MQSATDLPPIVLADVPLEQILIVLKQTEQALKGLKGKFPIEDVWFTLVGQRGYLIDEVQKRFRRSQVVCDNIDPDQLNRENQ